jgi:hypothetical protein
MTKTMEMLRLVGHVLMALGAWHHALGVIALGLFIFLSAWLRAVCFFLNPQSETHAPLFQSGPNCTASPASED